MLKAQELLAKHKLPLKEVQAYKIFSSVIKEKVSNISFRQGKWKAKLSHLVAENFGCYQYYKTRRTNTIAFFGKEEDILVCNIVLEYAADCIINSVKRLRYQYSKDGYSTKDLENDYALGFIDGLRNAFDEQKKKHQEWGLALVKDIEVVEAYEKIEFTNSINTSTNYQGHKEAYYKGHEDGERFSITDKIAEGDIQETLNLLVGN